MKMHLKLIVCKTEAILITVSNVNSARYCNGSVTCNTIACNLQLCFFWTWPTEFYGIYIYIYIVVIEQKCIILVAMITILNCPSYARTRINGSWQPLQGLWYWYHVMWSNLYNSFEDWAPIDFIYGCPIFNWVAETWLEDSAPGKQSR